MRILITGATGNVGQGMTAILRDKHQLHLHDLGPFQTDLPYFQGDLQVGQNLYPAMQGVDVVIHTPAWHGIHSRTRTRLDFWRLNVDGTYHVFDTAVACGVKKVVLLSSTAWYGHYDKYGFTKVIGEEICEYFWRNHQIKYAAIRPAAFVPFKEGVEGAHDMVRRFINADPDRRDVLECIRCAVESDGFTDDFFEVLSEAPFSADQIERWKTDPGAVLESHIPGAAAFAQKNGLELNRPLRIVNVSKTRDTLGWRPQHNLVTFMRELMELDAAGGIGSLRCDYPLPLR